MSGFDSFKLSPNLNRALEELGFDTPTEIQEKAIPMVKSGVDIIGIAQTGTGKTAAYLLPIFQRLKKAGDGQPKVLILVPTKELVLQVLGQGQALACFTNLRLIGLYGGVGPSVQLEEIEQGVDVIIATPGRFMDIYNRQAIKTKGIKTLILDEADRMMDMGFMPQIRRVQEIIPSKRQNLLFSATYPDKVEHLGQEFLDFPERLEVTPQASTAVTIAQSGIAIPNFMTKLFYLEHLLETSSDLERVIVFVRTREIAENIFRYLDRKLKDNLRVMHSNKGQNTRINAINDFREGNVRVLVSTDVSARGIDVPEVSHVINFTVPRHYEDYVHRVGRTGRAHLKGKAITFFDKSEEWHLNKIEELIGTPIERLSLPEGVKIEPSDKAEKQEQAMEIDRQKKIADPEFKGAFHEKKKKVREPNHNTWNPAKKSLKKKAKRRR